MAARTRPLRAVGAGEKSPATRTRKPKAQSVLEAVETGDFLDELKALRRRIATAISDPATPAAALASLTRQELVISKEIKAHSAADKGDDVGRAVGTPDAEWPTS